MKIGLDKTTKPPPKWYFDYVCAKCGTHIFITIAWVATFLSRSSIRPCSNCGKDKEFLE